MLWHMGEASTAPASPDDLLSRLDRIEVRHLRYFVRVARKESITAAADELRVAQPNLSAVIRRLEQRLGLQLFIRHPRGVELTAQGELFLAGVERLLRGLTRLQAEVSTTGTAVRVGLCSGLHPTVLQELEQQFCTHPDGTAVTALEPRSVPSAQQISLLRRGDLDLGVVRLPVDVTGLATAIIRDADLGVVLGATHPLAAHDSVDWHDLRSQRLLWFDTHRAPGFAARLLDDLIARGWDPELHRVESDHRPVFTHLLRSNDDLVALRPRCAIEGEPSLVWRPIASMAPHERIAVVAPAGGIFAELVHALGSASTQHA